MLGVSHAHPCSWINFATEESIEQRHIHDSSSTCVTQPVVFKWNQAHVLDRDSGIFPCPGMGNMLRAEQSMVGIHPGNIRSGDCDTTHSTPTYPGRETEREKNSVWFWLSSSRPHDLIFNPHNREENWQYTTFNSINNTGQKPTQTLDSTAIVFMSPALLLREN